MEGLVFFIKENPRVCVVTRRIAFNSFEFKDHHGYTDVISNANLIGCRILGSTIREAKNRFPEFLYELELLEEE